jgi:hypothetical protein
MKPKLTFGKKIGNLFSSGGEEGRRTSNGISSRDIVIPSSPRFSGFESDPFAPSTPGFRPAEWDGRTSLSASVNSNTGASSRAHTAPPTPSNASSVGGTEREEKENLPTSRTVRSAGLDDLLSRFEREEKERIRMIAQAKKALLQQSTEAAPAVSVA